MSQVTSNRADYMIGDVEATLLLVRRKPKNRRVGQAKGDEKTYLVIILWIYIQLSYDIHNLICGTSKRRSENYLVILLWIYIRLAYSMHSLIYG